MKGLIKCTSTVDRSNHDITKYQKRKRHMYTAKYTLITNYLRRNRFI